MNVYVLTSSRADYGIYLPLLKRLSEDHFFKLNIIAFGSHLSEKHGYTVEAIKADGFEISHKIEVLPQGDSAKSISECVGRLQVAFAKVWKELESDTDLVFALGDRYEMFAAVSATIPFNIEVAHIHGGETTLGAIDNKYRHAITTMSKYHFTTTENFKKRVEGILGDGSNVWNVGSISLENIQDTTLLNEEQFLTKWNVDLIQPTVLFTFHPETVTANKTKHVDELKTILREVSKRYQVLITMPNMDTHNIQYRQSFKALEQEIESVKCVESLGTQSYFSAMNRCSFLLGNTSSGIIEAASFGKFVINLGNRQKGRAQSKNVFNTPVDWVAVQKAIEDIESNPSFDGENIYRAPNTVSQIISKLKEL